MSHKLHYFPAIARYLGLRWLGFRLIYSARQRLGFLRRRFPCRPWIACPLREYLDSPTLADPSVYLRYRAINPPVFFFDSSTFPDHESYFAQWDIGPSNPTSYSDDLRKGIFKYFEWNQVQNAFPPDWHINPFGGHRVASQKHWSEIDDFSHGDIKGIWELSRFGFSYALVRAYRRSGDERYAETFWQLVEDWREENPPNSGANWKCGQEIAFRVMAWCFGLYGFFRARATSAERVLALSQMIAVSGERIEGNIGYALSQRNNHGISEAVGLWTVGLLFPEFRHARRWADRGRRYLEEQGAALIYDDGSFSQQSVNYHRLMLHVYLWALRLGDLNGQPLSGALKARVRKAGEYIYQMQDDETGRVPWYGQNDGALILPLSNCDYLDFRPVAQAVHCYFTGERLFESGPWDEDCMWLFGPDALSTPVRRLPRADLQSVAGGYYTLRSSAGFVFVRCPSFRDRPGQADALHLDLWWRGQNIAVDAGTYSYNAPEPWNKPLASTAYHNTVTVDDEDQMDRVDRFLWLPWLTGEVRCMKRSSRGHLAYWEGSHDGYRRLSSPVDHRRGVVKLGAESWLILDCLTGSLPHRYRLHWLFPDYEYVWQEDEGMLAVNTEAGAYHVWTRNLSGEGVCSLVRGDEKSPRGWRAPYYSRKEPALSLELTVEDSRARIVSMFSPDVCGISWVDNHLRVNAPSWQADLIMRPVGHLPAIVGISLAGQDEDRLELS